LAGGDRLTDRSSSGRGLPASIGRPGPSAFHRLNPLTKATLATTTAIAAVVMGGLVAPLVLVAVAVALPALVAGVLGRLLRAAGLLALPIALSAFVVNLFFFPGGETVLLRLGPVVATAEGLGFALEILARIMAISGAITLFYLTTRPGELVVDLERRGISPRVAFVAHASVQTVPAMVDRASQPDQLSREFENDVWTYKNKRYHELNNAKAAVVRDLRASAAQRKDKPQEPPQ